MRAPPAAGRRRLLQNLWWRWRWRAMAGVSGRKKRTRRTRKKPNPTALLTDDLLVEIFALVPYRSLCSFRCVCTRWRAVIAHPDHRARLPQTLAGFLYLMPFDAAVDDYQRYSFTIVSGTGPPFMDASFSFLPYRQRKGLELLDCCNGLLLCRSYSSADDHYFGYLVLNPATKKWVAVSETERCWMQRVRLGFDPAVSPHFYVFKFQLDDDNDAEFGYVLSVRIYSSATGVWIHKKTDWSIEFFIAMEFKSVFLNGVLYVNAIDCTIGAVDVEGQTCRVIEFPRSKGSQFYDIATGFIDLSQGRLHLANVADMVGDKLEIYVLEDQDNKEWTLKHTVSFEHLVGTENVHFIHEFNVVAIHPDRNMVFFVSGNERTLMSYGMDSVKVCIVRNFGHSENEEHFLPYVPLFSKTLPVGGNSR